MQYPIFHSISNLIESELGDRNIKITNFRRWSDTTLNAAGLEITVDTSRRSNVVKSVTINFDWDRFREMRLAKLLTGMEKHPFRNNEDSSLNRIKSNIDIEISWQLNEKDHRVWSGANLGTKRIERATAWMDNINREIHPMFDSGNNITRWHVEVEGDVYGKYLSVMSLISYFQYNLDSLESINGVHQFIREKLVYLLVVSNKILRVAERTARVAA